MSNKLGFHLHPVRYEALVRPLKIVQGCEFYSYVEVGGPVDVKTVGILDDDVKVTSCQDSAASSDRYLALKIMFEKCSGRLDVERRKADMVKLQDFTFSREFGNGGGSDPSQSRYTSIPKKLSILCVFCSSCAVAKNCRHKHPRGIARGPDHEFRRCL
jgi:hypothetical protein